MTAMGTRSSRTTIGPKRLASGFDPVDLRSTDQTEIARPVKGPRHRRESNRGATLVEFAFVAPLGFLLLLSIIVAAIIVTNFIQVTNIARDGARIAAICGSAKGTPMPDGSGNCTGAAISTYITQHLLDIPNGQVTPAIHVCTPSQVVSGTCSSTSSCGALQTICRCQAGKIVEVDMSYPQPLYLPIVSNLLQSPGSTNGTRLLMASAQATCEQ
jgi:Flp pilus assembly protein TadG